MSVTFTAFTHQSFRNFSSLIEQTSFNGPLVLVQSNESRLTTVSLTRPRCSLSIKCRRSRNVCRSQDNQSSSPTSDGHRFRHIYHIQINLAAHRSATYSTHINDGTSGCGALELTGQLQCAPKYNGKLISTLCYEAKSDINLLSQPVFCPKRLVLYAVLTLLNHELKCLDGKEILVPVPFPEWTSSGNQIAVYVRTGLNAVLDGNCYPLTSSQDI